MQFLSGMRPDASGKLAQDQPDETGKITGRPPGVDADAWSPQQMAQMDTPAFLKVKDSLDRILTLAGRAKPIIG
jgi:hypothetical protein